MSDSTQRTAPIAVLGAGSWGSALAVQLARAGSFTHLWGRDTEHVERMRKERSNVRYLPGVEFPPTLELMSDLHETLSGTNDVVIAVPSHAFRALLKDIHPMLAPHARIAWATKGFELKTGSLPHQVVADVLGQQHAAAVLSGPTFAREVGAGLPTALTVASENAAFAASLAHSLSSPNFRAYTSKDVVGVEVGGAVKNVLAVAAGLSDGLGFGANTRVALIARGLTEMTRLGVALGGERDTFMGLAGLGDLVLTCTDDQSRNRRFGLLLAAGRTSQQALAIIGQAVEGYTAAKAVHSAARRAGVSTPICDGVYGALYEGTPPRDLVHGLMTRPIKAETD
jgi:glycerol-3-phosphate dehydrogenase (NAD(P)+)